jgi:hypothetical protein
MVELDDLSKLEFSSQPRRGSLPDDAQVSAIVKVRQSNYVPPGVSIRARIDDKMFTASCRADKLRELERDPQVESVALAQRLENID